MCIRDSYKGARIDYNTLLQEEPGNNTARLGRALLNQKELKLSLIHISDPRELI